MQCQLFFLGLKQRKKAPKRRYNTIETETASEQEQFEDVHDKKIQMALPISCSHQFSIEVIKSSKPKLCHTGFKNCNSKHVLELIVPDMDRKNINFLGQVVFQVIYQWV